jgi:mono/diheme cytochrome c family protein
VIRYIAFLPVIVLLGAIPILHQDSSSSKPAAAAFSVPPNIAAQTNPVHPTPEGLAKAKKMYGYDCAMCHGANGDGKGDMASSVKTPLKDWRDPSSLKGMTDGELFYIIQKGKGEMPGEGDRQNDTGIWNMVLVVQSFAKK